MIEYFRLNIENYLCVLCGFCGEILLGMASDFIKFLQAPPLAKKTASLIKKETLKKRISNIE